MPLQEDYVATVPVGKLGIIALDSCKQLGQKINDYLVSWRTARIREAHTPTVLFDGYERDSYLVDAKCPRFGSGVSRVLIKLSVGGDDLYILV